MTDRILTDNEIVKALECCDHNSIAGWLDDCENCPLKDNTKCISEIIYKTLDLINRLQAENERLKAEIKFSDYLEYETTNQIKAEAYKEFAELLCEIWQRYEDENISGIYVPKWVMRVYEELVGDDND